jgi:hypothetical protein
MDRPEAAEIDDPGRPPFFSTWKRLYAAVLLNLAGQIAVFYFFARIFR